METRAYYPVGTSVQFTESGEEAEIVSIEESDEYDEYQSETDVFVYMNGLVLRTDVDRIERA